MKTHPGFLRKPPETDLQPPSKASHPTTATWSLFGLRHKPDPLLPLFRPFTDSPLPAKVKVTLLPSPHYLMLQPPQGFCPALPLHTQSPSRITSTGKLLDTPSCPPPPTSHLHPAPQGRVGAPVMYPLPSGLGAPPPVGLPPSPGRGRPRRRHGGLVTQHRARPRGEIQETLRTGRVAGHISLRNPCHTTPSYPGTRSNSAQPSPASPRDDGLDPRP